MVHPSSQKQAFFLGSHPPRISTVQAQEQGVAPYRSTGYEVLGSLVFRSAVSGTSRRHGNLSCGASVTRAGDGPDRTMASGKAGNAERTQARAAPRLVLQDSLAPRKRARVLFPRSAAPAHVLWAFQSPGPEFGDNLFDAMASGGRRLEAVGGIEIEPNLRSAARELMSSPTLYPSRMWVGARRGFSGVLRCGQP